MGLRIQANRKGLVLIGYGPKGLTEVLKQCHWNIGGDFESIVLGDYVLTKPADRLCILACKVTVTEVGKKACFTVEGYSYRDMPLMLAAGRGPIKLAGKKLTAQPSKKNPILYRVTLT